MKINQLKAGAVLSYISLFIGNAILIIYTPIMLRLLGQSEYGLYNLVSSVVSYLGLLSFGFGSAYIRYYSIYKVNNDDKKIAKLNGMFITVFTVIGIVSLLAGSILVLNIGNIFKAKLNADEISKAKILMAILVFNITLSFPSSVFDSYITANEQYLFQRVVSMIKTITNPFIILPILLMGFRSVGMVVASTLLNITIEVIYAIFCFKKLKIKFDFKAFDFRLFKDIAIFSSFIFINIIVDQINWNVDKFLLGIYQGTIAVAIYGLAGQLNAYYMSFSTSVSSVFIPRINQLVAKNNDNNELTNLFTKVGRIQFVILSLVCTGLIFFGKPFISMWAGADYKNSYFIALILIIPVTIPLIQNLGIEIQRAKNMHKFRSVLYIGIAIANVLISIPLCKLYSGVGCAIGTAIALLIGNGLIMNIYYHKKVSLNMIYFWINILKFIPAMIIPIVAGVLIKKYINLYSIFNFILFGIIYVVLYCMSIWFIGLNNYEKDLISKPIKKVLIKLKLVKNADYNR